MDLNYFRKLYGRKLIVDELYLGYYLHLIQDIIFRNFVYQDFDWKSAIPGNVDKLHKDYELLNPYIIAEYELENCFLIPDKIKKEELYQIYPFDLEYTLQQLEKEFQPQVDGKLSFFTGAMVDAYIEKAYIVCMDELKAIMQGKNYMDPLKYAWSNQTI